MLEVFSTGIKLFAPSGARACSRLPGSSVRGSSVPGKSDSGGRRPGVSQADGLGAVGLRADRPCTGGP
jgi:hypothetical protein